MPSSRARRVKESKGGFVGEGMGEDEDNGSSDLLVGAKKKTTPKTRIPNDEVFYSTQTTNLFNRRKRLLKRLRSVFKDDTNINKSSLQMAKSIYTNGYKEGIYDENIFVFQDGGDVDVAFFKNILKSEFVDELEGLFKQAYSLRMREPGSKKRTIYTGLWSKMNPMNYVVSDNIQPSGKFVVQNILPKLSTIAGHFLEIVHPSTFRFFNELPSEAKMNGEIFPCSATNFLQRNTSHRIVRPHKDGDDYGMTMIFILGQANAPLLLPNQKTSFNTERGDLFMFKGCNFAHCVDHLDVEDQDFRDEEMRISFVLFGHRSLKIKPIYHESKKKALEMFDAEHPVEAALRRDKREEKKRKKQDRDVCDGKKRK